MNRGNVLLRVDGSAKQGMGRVARCLALANALQRRRYQMTFVSQLDNNAWPDRIRRFRHTVTRTTHPAGSAEDRADFLKECGQRSPVVVVTDSPEIDEEYLAMLSNRVPLVISLDSGSSTRFPSDLVLGPWLHPSTEDFKVYPGSQLVAGARYAMVRAEFRRARTIRATEPGGPTRVMIALGGGQVAKETAEFAAAILAHPKIDKVDCVIGVGTGQREKLDALASTHGERLIIASDARDMGLRMTKAHLLITGAGNSAMEAACVGMPMIVVPRNAEQEQNAIRLEEIGVCQYHGPLGKVTGSQISQAAFDILGDNFERKAMSRSGRLLVDGRGADRLVTATEILLRRSRQKKALAA